MREVIWVLLSLLGVIGLIVLTYVSARWLNRRVNLSGSRSIKVLEKAVIGQDKTLAVVQIGEKLMLLGITDGHIDKLSDLDKEDITAPPAPEAGGSFMENLKKAAREQFTGRADGGGQGENDNAP